MSPPLVGVEGEGPPPIITDSHHQQQQQVDVAEAEAEQVGGGVLKEHNYFGVSDCTSSKCSTTQQQSKERLNLKATELRLGLPGSESPPRQSEQDMSLVEIEKPLFPLSPAPLSSSAGTKRPYSHTLHSSTPWMFHPSKPTPQLNAPLSCSSTPSKSLPPNDTLQDPSSPNSHAPAPKAQVVGWPPIRSFRKNTLATTSNTTDPLFVKVSMDGAPYLRKVDLSTYSTYQQLSSALHNMFTSFTLGQCGTHKASGRDHLTETKLKDLLNGSEYVLTYEDKDGDWMLVGDVPWEMFIDTCKRLKIMKSCDAIGLGPRGIEKSKTRS